MNEQIARVPKKIMFAPTIPITTQPIQLMFRPPKEDRRGQPAAYILVRNISIIRLKLLARICTLHDAFIQMQTDFSAFFSPGNVTSRMMASSAPISRLPIPSQQFLFCKVSKDMKPLTKNHIVRLI